MAAPRLLDKKVVATEIASQRKQLIDQGSNLARKVDAIRETKIEEEGNLEKFRTQTIGIVQKEIDEKIKQRDELRFQIKGLEKERKLLQMPLDKEWEKIKTAYLKYSDDVEGLESAKTSIQQKERDKDNLLRELALERNRIEDIKKRTVIALSQADEELQNAQEESLRIKRMANSILASSELREQVVSDREKNFLKESTKENQRLKEWEIALNKRDQEKIVQELIKHSPISKL